MTSGCETLVEAQWRASVDRWRKELAPVVDLLPPVILNMLLTVTAWVVLYDAEALPFSAFSYFLDAATDRTTGSDFMDGLINGAFFLMSMAAFSFLAVILVFCECRRFVLFILYFSNVVAAFAISAPFFKALFAVLVHGDDASVLAAFATVTYGSVGCLVFFSELPPATLRQFYVLSNCSLVSLHYLRAIPGQTAWFILAGVVGWDIFAVLSPSGPLRKLREKASDYSEDALNLLMFTASDSSQAASTDPIVPTKTAHEHEENLSDIPTAKSGGFSDDDSSVEEEAFEPQRVLRSPDRPLKPKKKSALDALNDRSATRLGMGDFIFYSVLVSKSAASGSVLATFASALGVLVGLVATFVCFDFVENEVPALPVSLVLGAVAHFGTLYLVQPMIHGITVIGALV
ncbi:presenilin spe-4 [Aphelenchoides avenae]|nr:presenilin spe-4 [Aphelenchus avenae]